MIKHVFISSLEDKMKFVSDYYVTDVFVRETKGNPPRPFWDLEVRDSSGTKLGRVWAPRNLSADEAKAWLKITPKSYVATEAHTEVYNGELRLVFDTVVSIDKSEVEIANYVKTSDRKETDTEALDNYINFVQNPTLKQIIEKTIGKEGCFREQFVESPAAENGPYNVSGGALMQAIDSAATATAFVSLASPVSLVQEIVIVASLLSNVGKIFSYKNDSGVSKMTTKGRLFGESALSSRAIERCFADPEITDYDIYLRLLHAVSASRWNGCQPQSYEAVVVRHVYDLTDAASHVQNVISSARGESIGGSDFTPFDGMTRRCYLKQITEKNE